MGVPREQPLQVALGAGPAQVVKQRREPAFLDQVDRGVDAEEAGPARDQDPALRLGRDRRPRPGFGEAFRRVHRRAYVSRWICL